jgi:6-phosphogluconate dehydrogenase
MQIGIIGLGRMGANMARRLMKAGHDVVVYNHHKEKMVELVKEGATGSKSVHDLILKLKKPRVVWIMLPAGHITEKFLAMAGERLMKGDILIEGGNSHYKEDIKRYELYKKKGTHYLDAGVSGGIWGLKNGYATMVGGDKSAFDRIEPIVRSLAPDGGYLYCGGPGAGHFVKMTHNAIEYGLMEAYAEGFEILKASKYGEALNLSEVASMWNSASVVKSWLLELLISVFKDPKELESLQGYVEDSGEARWAVKEAIDTGVAADVITASLYKRFNSRQSDVYANKVIASLRREFGGHMVAKSGMKVKMKSAGSGAIQHARPDKRHK